ncbi:MAG: aspartyl protease family protein [Saprospiraceae bacterium]|nr:aspartyl protease family protein [Saprospiraceae bacterium]
MKWMIIILILAHSSIYGQQAIAFLNKSKPEVVSIHSNKPANSYKIPIEIVRGMIYLEAEMNGTKGLFILDTGAPSLIVNQDKADGQQADALSLNAGIQVVETKVESFKIGGIRQRNLDALALDLSHLEQASGRQILGLVGYNVFEHFALLFDFDQQVLFLSPSSQKVQPSLNQPEATLPFTLHDHLPIVTVSIGKKQLKFGIDTGAASNLLDKRFLEEVTSSSIQYLPNEEIQGLDRRVQIVQAAKLTVNGEEGWDFGRSKFLFTDLSFLREHTGCQIDGLLGSPFLAKMDFSIDYPKRKINLWTK